MSVWFAQVWHPKSALFGSRTKVKDMQDLSPAHTPRHPSSVVAAFWCLRCVQLRPSMLLDHSEAADFTADHASVFNGFFSNDEDKMHPLFDHEIEEHLADGRELHLSAHFWMD